MMLEYDPPLRTAQVSACGRYRYNLTRTWAPGAAGGGTVLWVMLNPSVADAAIDDPTIRKCVGFAKRWDAGAIAVVNLFAFRATDPVELELWSMRGMDVVGPENGAAIDQAMGRADRVVFAWGSHRSVGKRGRDLFDRARALGIEPLCIGTTKSGEPRHPLMVSYAVAPTPWSAT